MGTNYYLHKPLCNVCKHCGHGDEPEVLHIGKSSRGWCFSLHVEPEEGIHDLEDWFQVWEEGTIKSEYGDVVSPVEMLSIITERGCQSSKTNFDYNKNHSVLGPADLMRHAIGYGCLKHGKGTWDCISGEFS
jgi:hypothetical protein